MRKDWPVNQQEHLKIPVEVRHDRTGRSRGPVQNGVAARGEEAWPLRHVGADEKKLLPSLAHREHTMRPVAVEEEGLKEDRQLPVGDEEQGDDHGTGD